MLIVKLLLNIYQHKACTIHGIAHYRVRVVMFNAIFNNISVISWQACLLVEETGVLGVNHLPIT